MMTIVSLGTANRIGFTRITAGSIASALVGLITSRSGITEIIATLATLTGAAETAASSTMVATALIYAISPILGCS